MRYLNQSFGCLLSGQEILQQQLTAHKILIASFALDIAQLYQLWLAPRYVKPTSPLYVWLSQCNACSCRCSGQESCYLNIKCEKPFFASIGSIGRRFPSLIRTCQLTVHAFKTTIIPQEHPLAPSSPPLAQVIQQLKFVHHPVSVMRAPPRLVIHHRNRPDKSLHLHFYTLRKFIHPPARPITMRMPFGWMFDREVAQNHNCNSNGFPQTFPYRLHNFIDWRIARDPDFEGDAPTVQKGLFSFGADRLGCCQQRHLCAGRMSEPLHQVMEVDRSVTNCIWMVLYACWDVHGDVHVFECVLEDLLADFGWEFSEDTEWSLWSVHGAGSIEGKPPLHDRDYSAHCEVVELELEKRKHCNLDSRHIVGSNIRAARTILLQTRDVLYAKQRHRPALDRVSQSID